MRIILNRLVDENDPYRLIKLGIWGCFFLLLFEGALRKWFLPGLAAPLLIVRDPVAIFLLFHAWRRNLLPPSIYLVGMLGIGTLALITTLIFGHGNLAIGIFGARILMLQFPVIFVIGKVFSREDVIKVGKIMLWIAIPMIILISLQFYSPQSAWVNRGVGGDMEGSGFSGAMGYFRPSGTFSFTTGNTMFFSLLTCFVFYFWIGGIKVNRLLLIAATIALFIAIPLSISRSLLFQVIIGVAFAVLASIRNPKYAGRFIGAGIAGFIILGLLNNVEIFQTSTEVFTSRFETASKVEGGLQGTLVDRYFGNLISAVSGSSAERIPFWGYGIGLGTNVASFLLTGGRNFLVAEDEWLRLMGEMGFLMGFGVILIRLGICLQMALASYQSLKTGDFLPWMLLSFCLLIVPQGQWAQPTALGFAILIGGLLLASLNHEDEKATPHS
ncbi:hypothetical protein [Salegentibacter sp. Hel_I_6]|uniref:hypothetical protein n=1 Tax=Salegentibacter sp. Hel_I_6 TaxID=1250278 RepID=UPI000689C44B|nr:hypothetical protein [Salegentibacter sp. Hel_I_6]